MATKVKGEAIKEGSIPLSALDDNLKSEFNCKYGLSGIVTVLNSNNTTSDIFPIGDYFVYVSSNKTIIKLNIGGQTNLSQLNGPSTIINCEVISGSKVKFSVSGEGISFYGNLIIGNKYNEVSIPTPDWNAQKGEAGYIENKPITKKFIKEQLMEFSEVDEWTSVYNGYEAVPSNTTIARVFVDITTYRGEHITTTAIVQNGSSVSILENDEENCLQISMYDTPNGITMNVGASFEISGTLKCHYYEEFKQLDEDYIPDIVLKTTPQTLTNTDKNQALANLGIDEYIKNFNKKGKLNIKFEEISFDNTVDTTLVTAYGDGLDILIDNIKTFVANCVYYNIIGTVEWNTFLLPCCLMYAEPNVFNDVSVSDIKTKIEQCELLFGTHDVEGQYLGTQVHISLLLGQVHINTLEL